MSHFSGDEFRVQFCPKPKYHFFFCIICIFLIFYSLACSGVAPEIFFVEHSLTIFQQGEDKSDFPAEVGEYLSVSVLADDQDGFGEIQQLYIIHDETELYWLTNKDEWRIEAQDDNDYIIVHELHRQQYLPFPRGGYRLLLLDYSGFRDEVFFTIDEVFSPQEIREYTPFLELSSRSELRVGRKSDEKFDTGLNEVFISIMPFSENEFGIARIESKKMTSGLKPHVVKLGKDNQADIKFFSKGASSHQIMAYFKYSDTVYFRSLPLLVGQEAGLIN